MESEKEINEGLEIALEIKQLEKKTKVYLEKCPYDSPAALLIYTAFGLFKDSVKACMYNHAERVRKDHPGLYEKAVKELKGEATDDCPNFEPIAPMNK